MCVFLCDNITVVSTNSPLQQYYRLVESGTLRADEHQTRIIQRLQRLHDDLANYDPPLVATPSTSNSIVRRFMYHIFDLLMILIISVVLPPILHRNFGVPLFAARASPSRFIPDRKSVV